MWSDKALRWLAALSLVAVIASYSTPTLAEIISAGVSRVLPTAVADGSNTKVRLGRYGEQFSIPLTPNAFGDEGSYFHATTATPGTAYNLTGATQTAWVATTPTFVFRNNDTASTGKRVYMDFIRLNAVTANTGGTNEAYAVVIDTGTRYSSAGTALTAYNVNYDSGATTIVNNLFAGVVTATAATTPRYVCRGNLKNAILAVGDTFTVSFGTPSDTTSEKMCPPAIVGGGQSLVFYVWATAQSATATGEVTAGWWER